MARPSTTIEPEIQRMSVAMATPSCPAAGLRCPAPGRGGRSIEGIGIQGIPLHPVVAVHQKLKGASGGFLFAPPLPEIVVLGDIRPGPLADIRAILGARQRVARPIIGP